MLKSIDKKTLFNLEKDKLENDGKEEFRSIRTIEMMIRHNKYTTGKNNKTKTKYDMTASGYNKKMREFEAKKWIA